MRIETTGMIKISKAAKEIGVSSMTLKNYYKYGKLKLSHLPSGHYLVSREELDLFKEKMFKKNRTSLNCTVCGRLFKPNERKCLDRNHNTGKTQNVTCLKCGIIEGHIKDYTTEEFKNLITHLNAVRH